MSHDGMSREEYEEYQKQMVEEKMERDAEYATRKAERACLRTCLREKYRIPKAGDDIDVPEELIKMVDGEAPQEEEKESIMGQMQNLQNMDMGQLKEKAHATFVEMKSKAEEKCTLM
ncbi:complexin-4-like isoform X1 [Sinocyclocheilus grahami]|uniref:complexin-4-like isoform X1 n=1 Tax=Sinocyclocheilus grahami TaxID=75366 RepID=UPI0007AC8C99|nr:PREDICTED: complexin-4-like isoform X1 [Sinocyclocheilus grahami]